MNEQKNKVARIKNKVAEKNIMDNSVFKPLEGELIIEPPVGNSKGRVKIGANNTYLKDLPYFGSNGLSDGTIGDNIAKGEVKSVNAMESDTIQLGEGSNVFKGTLQFRDYTLVDEHGNIPSERLQNAPNTVQIQGQADYNQHNPSHGEYIQNKPFFEQLNENDSQTITTDFVDYYLPTKERSYAFTNSIDNLQLTEGEVYEADIIRNTTPYHLTGVCSYEDLGYPEQILTCHLINVENNIFNDEIMLIPYMQDEVSNTLKKDGYSIRVYSKNFMDITQVALTKICVRKKILNYFDNKFLITDNRLSKDGINPVNNQVIYKELSNRLTTNSIIKTRANQNFVNIPDGKDFPIQNYNFTGTTIQEQEEQVNYLDCSSLHGIEIEGIVCTYNDNDTLSFTGLTHNTDVLFFHKPLKDIPNFLPTGAQDYDYITIGISQKKYENMTYMVVKNSKKELLNTRFDGQSNSFPYIDLKDAELDIFIVGDNAASEAQTPYPDITNGFCLSHTTDIPVYVRYGVKPALFNRSPIINSNISNFKFLETNNLLNISTAISNKNISVQENDLDMIFNGSVGNEPIVAKEIINLIPGVSYTFSQSNYSDVLYFSILEIDIKTDDIISERKTNKHKQNIVISSNKEIKTIVNLVAKNNSIFTNYHNFYQIQYGNYQYKDSPCKKIITPFEDLDYKIGKWDTLKLIDGKWSIENSTKRIILDGSEEWITYASNPNVSCFILDISKYPINPKTIPCCDAFTFDKEHKRIYDNNIFYFNIINDKINYNELCFNFPLRYVQHGNQESLKNWLNEHPIQLEYCAQEKINTTILPYQVQHYFDYLNSCSDGLIIENNGYHEISYIETQPIHIQKKNNIFVPDFSEPFIHDISEDESVIISSIKQEFPFKNGDIIHYRALDSNKNIIYEGNSLIQDVNTILPPGTQPLPWPALVLSDLYSSENFILGNTMTPEEEPQYFILAAILGDASILDPDLIPANTSIFYFIARHTITSLEFDVISNLNNILPEYAEALQPDMKNSDEQSNRFVQNKEIYDYGYDEDDFTCHTIISQSENEGQFLLPAELANTMQLQTGDILEGTANGIPFKEEVYDYEIAQGVRIQLFGPVLASNIDGPLFNNSVKPISGMYMPSFDQSSPAACQIFQIDNITPSLDLTFKIIRKDRYKKLSKDLIPAVADFYENDATKSGYIKNNPFSVIKNKVYAEILTTSQVGEQTRRIDIPAEGSIGGLANLGYNNMKPAKNYEIKIYDTTEQEPVLYTTITLRNYFTDTSSLHQQGSIGNPALCQYGPNNGELGVIFNDNTWDNGGEWWEGNGHYVYNTKIYLSPIIQLPSSYQLVISTVETVPLYPFLRLADSYNYLLAKENYGESRNEVLNTVVAEQRFNEEQGFHAGPNSHVENQGVSIGHNASSLGGTSVGNTTTAEMGVSIGRNAKTKNHSIAVGSNLNSNETLNSLIIGNDITHVGNNSINIGQKTSTDANGISIGENTISENGISIGKKIKSTNKGIAIGETEDNNIIHANNKSIAIGYETISISESDTENSIAIGCNANAQTGVAIGQNATAQLKGIAIGSHAGSQSGIAQGSNVTTENGIAVGAGTTSTQGIAIGNNAHAQTGIAQGTNTTATNESIAIGNDTESSGLNNISIGKTIKNNNSNGIAIGSNITTTESASINIGHNANAKNYGIALGTETSSRAGIAIGTITSTDDGVAIGQDISAIGAENISIGHQIISSERSIALGSTKSNTDNNAISIGFDADAAENGISIGDKSRTTGAGISIGKDSSSVNGFSGGNGAKSVDDSIAIGNGVEAKANDSIAIGQSITSVGQDSIAIGNTVTIKNNAIAIGANTSAENNGIAIGDQAHANANEIVLGNKTATAKGALTVYGDELLDNKGKIPEDRMTFSNTMQPAKEGTPETNLTHKAVVKRYIDDISDNITIIKNANGGFAAGENAIATTGIAIGKNAISENENAIQLGPGTNNQKDTLQVFGGTLLNASHKIPESNYDFAATIDDANKELVKRSVIKNYVDNETTNRVQADNDIVNNISIISNSSGGFAAGTNSSATTGVAIGKEAKSAATNAIQLGAGTNATANTFQVMNATVLDANHHITENNYNFMDQMADDETKRELVKRSVIKQYVDNETTARKQQDTIETEARIQDIADVNKRIDDLGAVFNYQGIKETYAELEALQDKQVGDVWTVAERDNLEYVCVQDSITQEFRWESLGVASAKANKIDFDNLVNNTTNISNNVNGGFAAGQNASQTGGSIAIGKNAHATIANTIQLGPGEASDANTLLYIGNGTKNYELLDVNGIIPEARISKNFATETEVDDKITAATSKIIIDQAYNSMSANAQSGVAIAQALQLHPQYNAGIIDNIGCDDYTGTEPISLTTDSQAEFLKITVKIYGNRLTTLETQNIEGGIKFIEGNLILNDIKLTPDKIATTYNIPIEKISIKLFFNSDLNEYTYEILCNVPSNVSESFLNEIKNTLKANRKFYIEWLEKNIQTRDLLPLT